MGPTIHLLHRFSLSASLSRPSRGVLVVALADLALLALPDLALLSLQALVDDVVASDCGLVRGAGSFLPVIHAVDVSAVAFAQLRASFLLGLVAPSTIACLSSALSLVLWEKLFGGCLAGGHFFAGTQYCSFLRAIFESNDSKKRYSGHTGMMTTKYFYTLKKDS